MNAAAEPRTLRAEQAMLTLDPVSNRFADRVVGDLRSMLGPHDVLVVNDSATLPASLPVVLPSGASGELRLTAPPQGGRVWAVLFGAGDWRTPTESRPLPEPVARGQRLRLPGAFEARVANVSELSPRLLELDFDRSDDVVLSLLYAHARPIQYAYLREPLPLSAVQTGLGGPAWSVEMPSAARPLQHALLADLRRQGVAVARLTHAAGLSSTGDAALDSSLPWIEAYTLPAATLQAVERAHAMGGQVLAVGTTVVRALEGAARKAWRPGPGTTDLVIADGFRPQVIDGLLSGVHDPGTSHHRVVSAFASSSLVDAALEHAERASYLVHEFGDSSLVWPGALQRAADAA